MQKQEDVQAGRWEIMFESLFGETRLSAGDVSSRDGMGWGGCLDMAGIQLTNTGLFFFIGFRSEWLCRTVSNIHFGDLDLEYSIHSMYTTV